VLSVKQTVPSGFKFQVKGTMKEKSYRITFKTQIDEPEVTPGPVVNNLPRFEDASISKIMLKGTLKLDGSFVDKSTVTIGSQSYSIPWSSNGVYTYFSPTVIDPDGDPISIKFDIPKDLQQVILAEQLVSNNSFVLTLNSMLAPIKEPTKKTFTIGVTVSDGHED
jgi:hypothetical protein